LHHELMSAQRDKRERSVSMSSGRQLSWNCVVGVHMRQYGVPLRQIDSVYETKQCRPRTEPLGALQPTEKLDVSRPLYVNV